MDSVSDTTATTNSVINDTVNEEEERKKMEEDGLTKEKKEEVNDDATISDATLDQSQGSDSEPAQRPVDLQMKEDAKESD